MKTKQNKTGTGTHELRTEILMGFPVFPQVLKIPQNLKGTVTQQNLP